jgi:hypothetical protein
VPRAFQGVAYQNVRLRLEWPQLRIIIVPDISWQTDYLNPPNGSQLTSLSMLSWAEATKDLLNRWPSLALFLLLPRIERIARG